MGRRGRRGRAVDVSSASGRERRDGYWDHHRRASSVFTIRNRSFTRPTDTRAARRLLAVFSVSLLPYTPHRVHAILSTSEPSVFSAHDPPQFRTQRLLPLSVIAFASRHHIRVRSLQEHQSLFHASLYALVDHHALQLTHRAVHVPVRAHVHADALGFAPDLAASRRGRRGVPKNPERGETPTGVAERRRAIGGPKRALRRGRASRRGRRGPRRARSRRPSSRRERREPAEGPRQTPNQLVHGASASVTARWVPQVDGSSGAPVSDGQHARIDRGDFFFLVKPIARRYR